MGGWVLGPWTFWTWPWTWPGPELDNYCFGLVPSVIVLTWYQCGWKTAWYLSIETLTVIKMLPARLTWQRHSTRRKKSLKIPNFILIVKSDLLRFNSERIIEIYTFKTISCVCANVPRDFCVRIKLQSKKPRSALQSEANKWLKILFMFFWHKTYGRW